ncbi:hypothetical protein [Cohaesibacter celericrescens]|nr:hypothetical protein [Cohaesibacter celericrescens]
MKLADEPENQIYDFGWWPEIFGALGVAALLWFLISYASGFM